MAASLSSGIDRLLMACEAAGELSSAIKQGQAGSNEHHRLGENAQAFTDILMEVVVLAQELVPSPGLENLLHVTKESADQRAPALRDELSKICAQHDGNLSPGSQQKYSLKAAFEKAKAASLERARLGALCEALRRDTEQIAALTAQVSRESGRVDHFTLESGLTALDQLVQRVGDSSAGREQRRGGQCLAESSVVPRLGATGTEGPRQNGATHDEGGSAFGTGQENTTTDKGRYDGGLAMANTIGDPPGPQNMSRTPKRKRSTLAREEVNGPPKFTIADLGSSKPSRATNDPLQDYHMQVMLIEQLNKRLMMARRQSNGLPVLPEPTRNLSPVNSHALQDYQMQVMLIEQQNMKRLMMARQEQDNTPVPPDPTSSPSTTRPEEVGGSPELANTPSSPETSTRAVRHS